MLRVGRDGMGPNGDSESPTSVKHISELVSHFGFNHTLLPSRDGLHGIRYYTNRHRNESAWGGLVKDILEGVIDVTFDDLYLKHDRAQAARYYVNYCKISYEGYVFNTHVLKLRQVHSVIGMMDIYIWILLTVIAGLSAYFEKLESALTDYKTRGGQIFRAFFGSCTCRRGNTLTDKIDQRTAYSFIAPIRVSLFLCVAGVQFIAIFYSNVVYGSRYSQPQAPFTNYAESWRLLRTHRMDYIHNYRNGPYMCESHSGEKSWIAVQNYSADHAKLNIIEQCPLLTRKFSGYYALPAIEQRHDVYFQEDTGQPPDWFGGLVSENQSKSMERQLTLGFLSYCESGITAREYRLSRSKYVNTQKMSKILVSASVQFKETSLVFGSTLVIYATILVVGIFETKCFSKQINVFRSSRINDIESGSFVYEEYSSIVSNGLQLTPSSEQILDSYLLYC